MGRFLKIAIPVFILGLGLRHGVLVPRLAVVDRPGGG